MCICCFAAENILVDLYIYVCVCIFYIESVLSLQSQIVLDNHVFQLPDIVNYIIYNFEFAQFAVLRHDGYHVSKFG